MTYTSKPGQSLLDITMQLYGTAEALPGLAWLNGIEATAEIEPGTVLAHDATPNSINDYFNRHNITVAGTEPNLVGAMVVGTTFVIL